MLRIPRSTFLKCLPIAFEISAANKKQLYVPPGFAHGYLVLSERSIFHYKCTNYYDPKDEYGILWEDPTVDIEWPDNKKKFPKKILVYPF